MMHSVEHTKSFAMAVPIARLFPLFSPEGEKLWVPEWDYENVMGHTELAEDYVFLTRTHDHRAGEAVWVVKRYEPEAHLVEFYKVEPGDKVGTIRVRCTLLEPDRTEVEVTYRYQALSATGEAFVAGFTTGAYSEFIGEWQTLLERHFASGS